MFSILVALLSVAPPAPNQQPGTPLTIPPSVAQIVIVDAYVIDAKGQPVTGLKQEDFELLEDNQRVPIAAFRPPRAVSPSGVGPRPGETETSQAPAAEKLTVAIYVDRWLLSAPGRKRALDQAAALAASHIAQGAQAIVIADERGLRALTPLTRDPAVVRAELTRLQSWATTSPGVGEGRQVLDNVKSRIEVAGPECPDLPPCLCVLPELIGMVRTYSGARARDVQGASERLSFLVGALGSLDGRKALIYVSDGLEQRPGIHLYDQLGAICPPALEKEFTTITAAMQEWETSPPLREAAARANAARVSLYPIDARGLTGFSAGDISQADREYVATPRNDSIRDANLVNPLQLLAEETGGFPLLRGLDAPTAMKRFEADARGHYVLGFAPGEPDGRTHALELRLTTEAAKTVKAEVRHRRSYRRAVSLDRRGQRALSTMVFGLEEDGLGIEAEVQRMTATTAQVRVVLLLSSLKAATDKEEARVKMVVSFRNSDDEKAAPVVREKDVIFPLGARELEREGGLREMMVEVPIGPAGYDFVIGVEDVTSGVTSYLKRVIPPPS